MRIFLIFIFLLSGIFLSKLIFSEYFTSKKEVIPIDKKIGLMNEIVIPIGMEDDYKRINSKYEHMFDKNNANKLNAEVNNNKQKSVEKKYTEVDLKEALLDNKEKEIGTTTVIVSNKLITEDTIKNKVLKYNIIDEHLILDIVLFNDSSFDTNGILKIKCDLFLDNNIVSKSQKNGEIKLKSKEKIRIKDLNLGFIEYVNFNRIECKVE